VPPGDTAVVAFEVVCVALGSVQVTVATSGVDPDPNGYSVGVERPGFGATADVAANGTATFSGLFPGDYSVSLRGMSLNCGTTSANPTLVTVPSSGGTFAVSFSVTCPIATELAVVMASTGGPEIYVLKSNGAVVTQLTSNAAYEDGPAWSPDGSKIAFRSDRDGNAEIYVANSDGSNPTRLTNHGAADYRPAWSPDGTKIAFVSERDGNAEIYLMNPDGTGALRLTTNAAYDSDPAWSFNGSKIAFRTDRPGYPAIHVMNPDGSGVAQVTTTGAWDERPTWSPDGTRIAFSRLASCDYYYCERDLFVVNADGSGVTRLTAGSDDHGDPAWSPDGNWIAFNAAPCDYYYGCFARVITAVRSDGTEMRELTGLTAYHPAWRP
jgi:Tol biopolymer transport system component